RPYLLLNVSPLIHFPPLSLHVALPISSTNLRSSLVGRSERSAFQNCIPLTAPIEFFNRIDCEFNRWMQHTRHCVSGRSVADEARSEEYTSELQSRVDLVCRLLLEKKKK